MKTLALITEIQAKYLAPEPPVPDQTNNYELSSLVVSAALGHSAAIFLEDKLLSPL